MLTSWIISKKKGCKQKNFALMSGGFTEADLTRAASLGYQVFEKPLDFDKITMWVEGIEWSIRPIVYSSIGPLRLDACVKATGSGEESQPSWCVRMAADCFRALCPAPINRHVTHQPPPPQIGWFRCP